MKAHSTTTLGITTVAVPAWSAPALAHEKRDGDHFELVADLLGVPTASGYEYASPFANRICRKSLSDRKEKQT